MPRKLTSLATAACVSLGLMLTGCYSSTGEAPLDSSLQLADLSDEEYRSMCDWHAEQEGYPDAAVRECPDPGFSRSPFTPVECMMAHVTRAADPDCGATVADWVECRRAVGDDLCQINHPACRWEGCTPSLP